MNEVLTLKGDLECLRKEIDGLKIIEFPRQKIINGVWKRVTSSGHGTDKRVRHSEIDAG